MTTPATFDPLSVIATFAGFPILAYAPDSMIIVAYNVDQVSLQMGAQGDPTRVISRNKSAIITLALQAASPTNDLLSAQALLDQGFPPTGAGEFLMKDLNGTTLAHAEKAWIKTWAKGEFAKDPKDREWVLETGVMDLFVGGMQF